MKTIKIEGNVYLARVIGPSSKYGVESDFIRPAKQISRRLAEFSVGPGVYKHEPRMATCDNMRRDTGYLHITENGDVREIDQAEALRIVAAQEKAEDPAKAKIKALAEIRALMTKHDISIDDLR